MGRPSEGETVPLVTTPTSVPAESTMAAPWRTGTRSRPMKPAKRRLGGVPLKMAVRCDGGIAQASPAS
jgi:hypothetical protein